VASLEKQLSRPSALEERTPGILALNIWTKICEGTHSGTLAKRTRELQYKKCNFNEYSLWAIKHLERQTLPQNQTTNN
jgi:hypothetical protein